MTDASGIVTQTQHTQEQKHLLLVGHKDQKRRERDTGKGRRKKKKRLGSVGWGRKREGWPASKKEKGGVGHGYQRKQRNLKNKEKGEERRELTTKVNNCILL